MTSRQPNLAQNIWTSPAILLGFLSIFIVVKIPDLFLPFHWDELGVYAKAALSMHDHNISLLPGSLPPELSRGHPLLCTVYFALAFRLFGPHLWVGHAAALLLSLLLLLSVFQLASVCASRRTGILAILLLIVQPVFFAQATMILPEVLLALCCCLALTAYLQGKKGVFALMATLAIMTKETAIALPCSLLFFELIQIPTGQRQQFLSRTGSLLSPLIVWGLFLLIQKNREGWFFFPLHTDYISFSLTNILDRGGYYLNFLFRAQGRWFWSLILFCAGMVFLCSSPKRAVQLLRTRHFLPLFLSFLLIGLIVSMLNFNLGRYMLFLLPVLVVLVAKALTYLASGAHLPRILAIALTAGVIFVPTFFWQTSYFSYDVDMGFRHVVKVQEQAAQFIEQHYPQGTTVMSSFPFKTGLQDPRSGYSTKTFAPVDKPCAHPQKISATLFVYTYPGNLAGCTPKTSALTLLKEYKSSFARALVYKKKDG